MLAQGQVLQGRYTILRRLGEGGMGAVYEATDERFGTPVALKEIIFEASNEQQRTYLAAAFEREAKSLAKARHECIPFVRDYFSDENREYLAMELVEGDDLGQVLQDQNKPFSLVEVTAWMRQLLDALDYIHNLKPPIIHRDIKPQNIKITDRKRLKLLDFGIAKSGDTTANTTHKQTFIGATLNYSPIEQILRVIDAAFREFIILKHEAKANAVLSQLTDERADIFSAGSTFYHLVTYVVPIEATKRTLAIWEGGTDPLKHPSDLNPTVPRRFGDFLLKAMAIERDGRFSTAAEMLDALNDATSGGAPERSQSDVKTLRLLDYSTSEPDLKGVAEAVESAEPTPEPETPVEVFIAPVVPDERVLAVDPPVVPTNKTESSMRSTKLVVASDLVPDDPAPVVVPKPDARPAKVVPTPKPKQRGFVGRYWPVMVAGVMLLSLIAGIVAWSGLSGNSAGSANTNILATPPPQDVMPSPTASPAIGSTVQTAVPTPSATPLGNEKTQADPVSPTPNAKPVVSKPIPVPQKTPPTGQRPSTKPTGGDQSPNCIFNGVCKK